ncbi:ABC transporter permease [Halosquirtibacter laminarini]|uniref:ABC transporter permease n=1 Tax=Halosquirtibacter laminarini TaxID=3374600 RepID=A0AC61NFZ0_9BACT|nr:ABC transporter permease [Prolixibacteraceae bacterium]
MKKLRYEFILAKKLFFSKDQKHHFSKNIINFAIAGISIGIIVIILAVSITIGFKKEVKDKVVGFGSHIQLLNYSTSNSYDNIPILSDEDWVALVNSLPNVKHIETFATKPGIIHTGKEIEGIVLKGLDKDHQWNFFKEHLIQGKVLDLNKDKATNGIMISQIIADRMMLKEGDPIRMYFMKQAQAVPQMRKFIIKGIFSTSLTEFDKAFALVDIRQIQHLNKWAPNQVSGFDITLHDFNNLDETNYRIQDIILNYKENVPTIRPVSITQKYREIFDWLNLIDMNVWVILGLMIAVAGFNMVSGLLILILERTQMIGILKAVGAQNKSIRKLFLYITGLLITKGLFWGNAIALILCFIQKKFGIIPLDKSSYYVDTVPIELNFTYLIILNVATLIITLIMLIIPSMVISRISPDKAIKFD